MKQFFLPLLFTIISIPFYAQNLVTNNSFEMQPFSNRPPYWYVGFSDTPDIYQTAGNWTLDSLLYTDGSKSLKLSPNIPPIPALDFIQYSHTQVVNVPTYNLSGKTISVSVDIRQDNLLSGAPLVKVFALNPADTLNIDANIPIGNEGYVILTADSTIKNSFQTYSGNFVASGDALALVAMLTVKGNSGNAWFDNLIINVPYSPPGSPVAIPSAPINERCFKMGLIPNDMYNLSEYAVEQMIQKMSNNAEVYNQFFAVRWTAFTNEPIADGFKSELEKTQWAKNAGMDIALTFDFTHAQKALTDTLGAINHVPASDSIVGTLQTPGVTNAIKSEILDICSLVNPEYVFVGVETNIFYEYYNSTAEWNAFVSMYKQIYDTLTSLYPNIHVSTYFTLNWLISPLGIIDTNHVSLWQTLLPELPSIAFSVYPNTFYEKDSIYVPGYFTKARIIAPSLPLLIPEFGIPGSVDTLAALDTTQQRQLLERIFMELDTENVEMLCWYSIYDQTFYPSNPILNEFRRIGFHQQDGTEKSSWGVWRSVYNLNCLPNNINQLSSNEIGIIVFPNPFSTQTTLQTDNLLYNATLTVYNLYGQTVKQIKNISGKIVTLHRDNLPSGLYFIRLTEKNTIIYADKFVIID